MHPRPIRCRRLRRTDADAVFALLEAAGLGDAAADRTRRHRFRLLAADLGGDCYVATIDETVVGVAHITYARHLLGGQRATVELLAVDPARPGAETVGALAALLAERARRRGCRTIDWRDPPADDAGRRFALVLGAAAIGEHLRVEIPESGE